MSRVSGRWPDNFREETSARGQVVQPCRGKAWGECASSAGLMLTPRKHQASRGLMQRKAEHPSFVQFLLTSCCFFFFKCSHHLALTFKTRMSPLPPAVFFMQHDWGASLKSLNTKLPYITCTDNATVLQSHCYRGRLCVQLELTNSLCDILHVLCAIKPPHPPSFFNTTWASPHTREYIRQADVVVCLLQILKISGNPFRLIWCLHKQKGLHGRRQHKHSSWSKCLLLGLFAQEVVRGKKDSTVCLLKHWPNMCLNYQTDSISKRPQFEVVDALLYI